MQNPVGKKETANAKRDKINERVFQFDHLDDQKLMK